MLKIYGQALPGRFRALWMAEEFGIPYEHVPVTISGDAAECRAAQAMRETPPARGAVISRA